MAGAVPLNPDNVKASTDYAMRRGGNWLAGPKAVENGWANHVGDFISPSNYGVRFYKYRQTMNQRRNIMREYEGGGTSETEAAKIQTEINKGLRQADTETEKREVWRSQMGY